MHKIKWDEKYFEQSGIYIWIYNQGCLVRTNEKYRNSAYIRTLKYCYRRNTVQQELKNNKNK